MNQLAASTRTGYFCIGGTVISSLDLFFVRYSLPALKPVFVEVQSSCSGPVFVRHSLPALDLLLQVQDWRAMLAEDGCRLNDVGNNEVHFGIALITYYGMES